MIMKNTIVTTLTALIFGWVISHVAQLDKLWFVTPHYTEGQEIIVGQDTMLYRYQYLSGPIAAGYKHDTWKSRHDIQLEEIDTPPKYYTPSFLSWMILLPHLLFTIMFWDMSGMPKNSKLQVLQAAFAAFTWEWTVTRTIIKELLGWVVHLAKEWNNLPDE